jgi:hypothetical protein
MKKFLITQIGFILVLAATTQLGTRTAAGQSPIPVPGTANPWLAGQPNGVTASGGSDSAPGQSPVKVNLVDFTPGDQLSFSATGSVDFSGGPAGDPPDGNNGGYRSLFHLFDSQNGGPENGIAGLNAPVNSLIGVFLTDNVPSGNAPAAFFNFAPDGNVPGNIDYTTLQPAIGQPFFIGDGKTTGGVSQRVTVPTGATRLFLGSMDGSGWFNNTGSFNVTISLAEAAPQPPAPPPHGGLSATTFRVNGSTSPAYPPTAAPVIGLADSVLQFAAQQTGRPAGLSVRVQATTTPSVEGSWTYLPNATHGQMTLDSSTNQFLVSSNDYPHQQADPVYFRAVASAPSYADSISNVVGPFNLTSSKPRFSSRLDFTAGGPIADLYFRSTESAVPSGLEVRVQSSTTPGQEASWTDLNNGNFGRMTQSSAAKQFLLLMNNFPTTKGVFFRAIARGNGFVDSISNLMGPYDITATVPPVVGVTTSSPLAGSGDGHDSDHPILLSKDNGAFAAGVQSATPVKTVKLQVDGHTVTEYPGSSNPNAVYIAYFNPTVGDHVYEAVAINNLGARSRAGTGAIYVRVIPSQTAARAERAAGTAAATASSGHTYRVITSGGKWSDANTWRDENGNHGVPGVNDLAVIGSSTVDVSTSDGGGIDVGSLTLGSGGVIAGSNPFVVHGTITLFGGSFQNVVLDIHESATMNLLNAQNVNFGGYLSNHGTLNIHGSGGLLGVTRLWNTGTINWLPALQIPPNAAIDPAAALRLLGAASYTGNGVITGTASALISQDGASLLSHDGNSLVAKGGGNIISTGAAGLVATGAGNLVATGAGNLVATGAGNLVATGAGNLVATGAGNLDAHGGVKFEANAMSSTDATTATADSAITLTGGEVNLSSCNLVGPVALNGGVISGTGFIQGDLTNNGGYLAPGHSAGAVAVVGNFAQSSTGTTVIEAGGGSGGQFDSLQISGSANLGGALDIKLINGYKPDPADKINPVGYASSAGSFASINSNAQVAVSSTGVSATVDPAKPGPSAGQPLNIATRLAIQGGDNVLIAGFIVTGSSGSTKKVLIRGLGPSLAQFGVPNTLSDPLLELHKPDGSIVSNDNWQQGDTSQIPSGFAPSDPRESVIVATLTPGNYSAVVKGAHGETGVGIAELYDLDAASAAKLANISTRGFVNAGDDVMIGGFIIGGTEPAKVLVRAIGPTLSDFGVQGALADPTLELHDANGATISNDDWRETQEAEITAAGLPPNKNQEPAILATLTAGSYTAVVRGKNNTTGIGLVEAYVVQ